MVMMLELKMAVYKQKSQPRQRRGAMEYPKDPVCITPAVVDHSLLKGKENDQER